MDFDTIWNEFQSLIHPRVVELKVVMRSLLKDVTPRTIEQLHGYAKWIQALEIEPFFVVSSSLVTKGDWCLYADDKDTAEDYSYRINKTISGIYDEALGTLTQQVLGMLEDAP
jgi:hypothetical protein